MTQLKNWLDDSGVVKDDELAYVQGHFAKYWKNYFLTDKNGQRDEVKYLETINTLVAEKNHGKYHILSDNGQLIAMTAVEDVHALRASMNQIKLSSKLCSYEVCFVDKEGNIIRIANFKDFNNKEAQSFVAKYYLENLSDTERVIHYKNASIMKLWKDGKMELDETWYPDENK